MLWVVCLFISKGCSMVLGLFKCCRVLRSTQLIVSTFIMSEVFFFFC
jgi:hypothetical protein